MKRPKTAAEMGLMQGFPPPPERLVTPDNWVEPPFSRWGFRNVRQLARTAPIGRGDGPVRELPRDPRDLAGLRVPHRGRRIPFPQVLDSTYTDGLVVVHGGAIVFEHYVEDMRPDELHLLMSVSKSLTATLAGVLAGRGLIDPAAAVTEYLPQLAGDVWEGCTLQHLLDMRAGIRFDEEDYDNPDSDGRLIEQVSGYTTHRRPDLPADTYEWIRRLEREREHGGLFRYQSILVDVLGWAMEAAAGIRLPELFSREIWSRIGADRDAEIIVDAAGFAVVEGGISTTLGDLARFGLMHLEGGCVGDRQVVPAEWIGRLLTPDEKLIAAFAQAPERHAETPTSYYHDYWWVWDAERETYSGYGINGQQLLIDRPSATVIARFSTWPRRVDDDLAALMDAANRAVLEAL